MDLTIMLNAYGLMVVVNVIVGDNLRLSWESVRVQFKLLLHISQNESWTLNTPNATIVNLKE